MTFPRASWLIFCALVSARMPAVAAAPDEELHYDVTSALASITVTEDTRERTYPLDRARTREGGIGNNVVTFGAEDACMASIGVTPRDMRVDADVTNAFVYDGITFGSQLPKPGHTGAATIIIPAGSRAFAACAIDGPLHGVTLRPPEGRLIQVSKH